MSKPITSPIPEIPGVDFLNERAMPSKAIAGPFHLDEIDSLLEIARAARNRAKQGLIFVAPEGIGFSIFKRKAPAK